MIGAQDMLAKLIKVKQKCWGLSPNTEFPF